MISKRFFIDIMYLALIVAVGTLYVYLKWNYFFDISIIIHMILDVGMIIFIYSIVQKVLLRTIKKEKRTVIYIITTLIFIVAVIWDIEHHVLSSSTLIIELYLLPIVTISMIVSFRAGLLFVCLSTLSHTIIKSHSIGLEAHILIESILVFFIFGLVSYLVDNTIKARNVLNNKQHILLQHANALILGVNDEGKIDLYNQSMADFLGISYEDMIGKYFWDVEKMVKDESHLLLLRYLNGSPIQDELQLQKGDKEYTFLAERYEIKSNGLIGGNVIVLRDITDSKAMKQKLEELSITDELTTLFNRRYFERKLEEEKLRLLRKPHPIGLFLIDIDKFKQINDSYGHLEGDQVIREVAGCLKENIRESDILARLGGDEFAIILPETDEEEATFLAKRLRDQMREMKVAIYDKQIGVTISIGGIVQNGQFDSREILEEADKALYHAKDSGRDIYYISS